MNISTYVTAVSLKPKQYVVAVYQNTKSLDNLRTNKQVLLQLLGASQVGLVNPLGKKSGFTYDKDLYLQKYQNLEEWKGYDTLPNLSAIILLKKKWSKVTGDHTLFLFDVLAARSFHNDPLTLQHLREKKLVRI